MPEKTQADADTFAAALEHADDALLFLEMWAKKEWGIIRGHFPAFMGGPIAAEAATDTDGAILGVPVATAFGIATPTLDNPTIQAADGTQVPLEKVHIYLGAAPETGAANMTPESQDNAANVPIQPPRTFEQPPEVITQFARVDAPDSPQ